MNARSLGGNSKHTQRRHQELVKKLTATTVKFETTTIMPLANTPSLKQIAPNTRWATSITASNHTVTDLSDAIVHIQHIYMQLEKVCMLINSAYGLPIMFIIVIKFTTLTALLYFCCMIIIKCVLLFTRQPIRPSTIIFLFYLSYIKIQNNIWTKSNRWKQWAIVQFIGMDSHACVRSIPSQLVVFVNRMGGTHDWLQYASHGVAHQRCHCQTQGKLMIFFHAYGMPCIPKRSSRCAAQHQER